MFSLFFLLLGVSEIWTGLGSALLFLHIIFLLYRYDELTLTNYLEVLLMMVVLMVPAKIAILNAGSSGFLIVLQFVFLVELYIPVLAGLILLQILHKTSHPFLISHALLPFTP